MSEEVKDIALSDNWMPKALIIGGVVGAAVGVAATYLLIQQRTDVESKKFSAGEGVKIGVLVINLLRNIANL